MVRVIGGLVMVVSTVVCVGVTVMVASWGCDDRTGSAFGLWLC